MRKFIVYFDIGSTKKNILQTIDVIVWSNTPREAIYKAHERIKEDYPVSTIQNYRVQEVIT